VTKLPDTAPGRVVRAPAGRSLRVWRAALVVAVALQLIALYSPQVPAGPQITGLDKVVHILIFAAPALAALMAGISGPWALGILAMNGPISELVQHFALAHRSGDPLDAMADLVGVGLGSLAYLVWSRRQS